MLSRWFFGALWLLAAVVSHAETKAGDKCTLSRELAVRLQTSNAGSMDTEFAKDATVVILKPGPRVTRIRSGELTAIVATEALEAVCAVPQEQCRLTSAIKMATNPAEGSESGRVVRVKEGTLVAVLEKGPLRSRVLVGATTGQMNSAHLREKCVPEEVGAEGASAGATAAPTSVARAGAAVAVIPFASEAGVSAIDARTFEDDVARALARRRKDVQAPMDPRPGQEQRVQSPEQNLTRAAELGRQLGVHYVVAGHLTGQGKERRLALSVYDVRADRLVRTIRTRPTFHPKDPWADVSSGYLHEVLPGGAKHVAYQPRTAAAATPAAVQPTGDAPEGDDLDAALDDPD